MGCQEQEESGRFCKVVKYKHHCSSLITTFVRDDFFYVSHTGGAIGASSVLLIAPKPVKYVLFVAFLELESSCSFVCRQESMLPQGVVVAILCNMQVLTSLFVAPSLS